MWKNIGKTMRNFAKAYFWINAVINIALLGFTIYGYMNYMMQGSLLMSIANVVVSFLENALFAFLLYGAGELIDHVKAIRTGFEKNEVIAEEKMPSCEKTNEEPAEATEATDTNEAAVVTESTDTKETAEEVKPVV